MVQMFAKDAEAVVGHFKGEFPFEVVYSDRYEIVVTFTSAASAEVRDGGTIRRAEDPRSSLADWVHSIWACSAQMHDLLPSIPEVTLRDGFGGEEGLAEALLKVDSAKTYQKYASAK